MRDGIGGSAEGPTLPAAGVWRNHHLGFNQNNTDDGDEGREAQLEVCPEVMKGVLAGRA